MPNPDYGIDTPTLSTVPDQPATRVLVASGPLFPRSDLNLPYDTPTYLGFGVQVVYDFDLGLGSSPRAGKKGESLQAFWRGHSGRVRKVVTWVASALNKDPVAPHPDTQCDNEVLVHLTLVSNIPNDTGDGQQAITIAGVYTYELQKTPEWTDLLFVGRSPFNVRAAKSLRVYDFSKYIIAASLSPATFQGQAVNY